MWYKRYTPSGWSEIYHLYDPWVYWQPRLTSPPSICVTPDDTVHILLNLYLRANGQMNAIVEWAFPLEDPSSITQRIIEDASYLLPKKVEYPSIAYSIDPAPLLDGRIILHATWQHADTIFYATRRTGFNWNIWSWITWNDPNRINSSHPFVETYGDMVTLVWSHKTGIGNLEDVYKTSRLLYGYFSPSENISQSPFYVSIYPVNSYDSYTLYTEKIWPQPNGEYSDIFLNGSNISNNWHTRSIFSHSSVKRTASGDYLYTIWLEGNEPPYEIKFATFNMGTEYLTPYITSIAGKETPSPYLIKRDTFFSNWQIPADIGYDYVKYRFTLYPGYRYVLKAIVYYEGSKHGKKYKEWIKIDNRLRRFVKYRAFEPETVMINIPPAFYKDSVIDVIFEKKIGEYAIAGPIYIYRFEKSGGRDEFVKNTKESFVEKETSIPDISININPFTIPFKNPEISIYDLTGRLIKGFNLKKFENYPLKGVYFIKFRDRNTGKEVWRKIVKIK